MAPTTVEILDLTLNKLAEVRAFYPLNKNGDIIRYSRELSDYGAASFRVSTKDPLLTTLGDILEPHKYHIRIKEDGAVVWSGGIVDNPDRNKEYVEVKAVEYDFYLDKVLIRRNASVTANDGRENYRTFDSNNMALAVFDVVDKAKTDFGANHPLANMTVSLNNIENPDYPPGFTSPSGTVLTGGWTFSPDVTLQFDYHSALYVLKAFGTYTMADFEITPDLTFYFKKFYGNKQPSVTFRYGRQGNVIDYNLPRLGQRMVNNLIGIAADTQGKVLHADQRDEASIQAYGLMQDAQAFTDVKDQNILKARINQNMLFTRRTTDSPVNIMLSEQFNTGTYGIGDLVTVSIKDHIIDFNQVRRIVGITTTIHNTGRRQVVVQTNAPRDKDLGI